MQEAPGLLVLRRAEHLLGWTALDDPPGLQVTHLIGDVPREPHLVRRDHHRHPVLLQLLDDRQHLAHEFGIKRAGHLVEQERTRASQQRPGDRDALLLAAGQAIGILPGPVGEPNRPSISSPAAFASAAGIPWACTAPMITFSSTLR